MNKATDKDQTKKSEQSAFEKRISSLRPILVSGGFIISILTVIAAIAFLTKEGEKATKPVLTQGDLVPLLVAVHTAWTKVPENRVASAELKEFDHSQSDLESALASIDWSKELKKSEAVKLQALTLSVSSSSAKLVKQLSVEDSDLTTAVAKVQAEARKLANRVEPMPSLPWNQQVLTAYSEAIKALAKLFTDWPFATIAGLILLFAYADKMGGISKVFGGVQSIKIAGGNEIIFSPTEAVERSRTANEVFKSYRDKATEEFTVMANEENIAKRLESVCEKAVKPYLRKFTEALVKNEKKINNSDPLNEENILLDDEFKKRWDSLRFTVFVDDLLFKNTLSQLVDYYPEQEKPSAGRAWSLRYGMVGHVWRMQNSYSATSVPNDDEDKLVKEWGMTRDEIRNFVPKKQTFTTVVLRDSGTPIALFYMDSDLNDVFALGESPPSGDGADPYKELRDEIENACEKFGLTRALQNVAKHIENRKLSINIGN